MKTPKLLLVILSMTVLSQLAQAQDATNPPEKKSAFSLTIGYAEKLDRFSGNSRGLHLGVNMYKANARRWSYDAQIAVSVTGGSNTYLTPILLGGGRYYFTSQEKSTRVFMNMLAGLAMELEFGSDFTEVFPDIGYSVGFFVQSKKFIYGVAVESPENLVFKLGITF